MKIGKVKPVAIIEEMKKSYLDYAMSVIVARALPDVRDGLKPVHRRILYAMQQMGLYHSARYTKSAKVVGETMGKYHPHGDMAIYDSLVRLAQDFSMRYPLIDGQGNFGSIDGDSAAAMRYTEVRMAGIASEMLLDLEKKTVKFIDNFDGSLKEPAFLPALLPNLLLMGSDGIAVGMATKIPPHNLGEVVNALTYMIEKGKVTLPERLAAKKQNEFVIKKISLEEEKKQDLNAAKPENLAKYALSASFESEATVEQLMRYIKGPDFPTGGSIYNHQEIAQAYATGKGKILMRAKAEIEEQKRGRLQIIISEIPYQVNKAKLVVKIAQLIRAKKIVGVTDLRDESDRQGLRIVLDLKRKARPKAILNSLFKFTPMQTTFPVNMVALIGGTPQTLTLKQVLTEYLRHRQKIVTKRSLFELESAKNRAHILEGLKIALDNLDEVIATIKRSKTPEIACDRLMKKFNLSEIQANAILEMRLRRLAALERKKIEDEYKEIGQQILYLTGLLANPEKILSVIKKELLSLAKKYADSRRTKIYQQPLEQFSEKDLVSNEKCLITLTKTGYIKRIPVGTYRSQRRGGKGVTGMSTKEADEIAYFLTGETHDDVLFFTNKGRVFFLPAWEIPEGVRTSKGQAAINLVNIDQGEQIQAVLNLKESFLRNKYKYLFMVTKKGMVKKTAFERFANIRSSGLIAIKLKRGDELCWVKPTTGEDHLLLVTHFGKSIHFNEKDVRPMGRDTMGVRGIRVKPGDFVVGIEVFAAKPEKLADRRRKVFRHILVVMEKGLGKRTAVKDYPLQKRGGIGVKAAEVTPKTGKIIACQLVNQRVKEIILTSKKAQVIKLPLKNIPRLGRATQGVILMRFGKKGDSLAAMTCLEK
jgi:DNA gyrase subunit A